MRKLVFAILGLVILCGAFVLLWFKGGISEGIFIGWMGGILGLVGIYTEGNVRSKRFGANENSENGGGR